MTEQQGSGSPQDRYYERYLADTGPNGSGDGGGGGNKRWAIGAGIAAVVVAATAVAAYAVTHNSQEVVGSSSSTPASSTSSTSSTTSGSSGSSESTTSSPTTTPSSVVNAQRYGAVTQPGWVTVVGSTKARAAYDVPKSAKYKTASVDTLIGYEAPAGVDRPTVVASSPSTFDKGFCSTYKFAQKAFLGFVNIGTREPAEAAPSVASDTADLLALKKDKKTMASRTPTKTTTVKVGGGKITAVQSVLTVDTGNGDPKQCDPPKSEIRTIAFSNGANGVSTLLLIERDVVAGQMPDDDVNKIIASLRPKIAS
ncbi:hypothetical protein [Calidifontibacter terrae]